MSWLAHTWIDYETIARQQIRDCYDWHQRTWDLFPGRPEGYPCPFLFRVIEKNEGCDLWLMCKEEPTRPEWADGEAWKISPVKVGFPHHRRYRFDLLANPTRRDEKRDRWGGRERERGKHRRFNLTSAEEQRAWIERKAGQHGFRLLEDLDDGLVLDIDPRRDFYFNRGKSRGLHIGVRYRGCLEVTNSGEFAKAFRQGIGPAKSFGFGLLLLQPIRI
jgi:CRISPR system Cascade subunit CasE